MENLFSYRGITDFSTNLTSNERNTLLKIQETVLLEIMFYSRKNTLIFTPNLRKKLIEGVSHNCLQIVLTYPQKRV